MSTQPDSTPQTPAEALDKGVVCDALVSSPKSGDYWQHQTAGKVKLVKKWNEREWIVEDERGHRQPRFLELMWPLKCPVTGRAYWGHVDHPTHGSVPTYGGPFDTYMIPERTGEVGADDEWSVERYDQDAAQWLSEGFL